MATLIAEIKLFDRECVPWSPPRTIAVHGKHVHIKNKDLIEWQDAIREEVSRSYAGEPYRGPVMIAAVFWKRSDDPAQWNRPWFAATKRARGGDQTNFLKAAEDAIMTWKFRKTKARKEEKVVPGVLADDSQTVAGYQRKLYGPRSGVELRIYALETDESETETRA